MSRHPRGSRRRRGTYNFPPVKESSAPEILECKGYKPEYLFFAMCQGASELRHHKPKEGDRYLHPEKKKVFILSSYCIRIDTPEHYYLAVPERALGDEFDVTKFDPNSGVSFHEHKEDFYPLGVERWTWLPTPEQFQDMLQPLSPMTTLHLFYGFVQQGKNRWHSFKDAPLPDPTMEQLWMCFTWKRLYDKIWAGFMKGWRKC